MKNLLLITTLIFSIFISSGSLAQNFTLSDIKYKKPDRSFKKSSKSRELKMKKGDSYELKLKFKKGRVYYISVCGDKYFNDVQYQLKYNNIQDGVLYDNSACEFIQYNTFRVKEDAMVTLEVKTQPKAYFETKNKKKNVDVLIAYKVVKHYEERKAIPDLLALYSDK